MDQSGNISIACRRVTLQRARDHSRQLWRNGPGPDFIQAWDGRVQVLSHHSHRIIALEWRHTGQHFVQNRAECINISAWIAALSFDLFWSHILERPDDAP